MSYKLPVYPDEELAKATSYPPLQCGLYDFEVTNRQPGTTSNGNHMEKVILDVYHRGKDKKPMKCYHNFFIEKDVKSPGHKYDIKIAKGFLDCIKIPYTPDAFDHVLHGKGRANFLVDTYKAKDGSEREKFVVPDDGFISPNDLNKSAPSATQIGGITPKPTVTESKDFDDDIPF